MTNKKSTSKHDVRVDRGKEVAGQLEQAFLAGLGALSNAGKMGEKAFENLVEQGQNFRKEATDRTEALIGNVQGAIREMTGDAQSRAEGLLSHMRETPQMTKLQSVFDERVADALDRIGVASRQSVDELNAKLDEVLSVLEGKKAAARKAKAPARKAAAKKASARKAPAKKASARKAAKKKPAKKKASRKKAASKKASSKKASSKKAASKKAG